MLLYFFEISTKEIVCQIVICVCCSDNPFNSSVSWKMLHFFLFSYLDLLIFYSDIIYYFFVVFSIGSGVFEPWNSIAENLNFAIYFNLITNN